MIEILKESMKNRKLFLEKKKQEFVNCESERKCKNLIIELIQLEPSHLAEDWIMDQIIKWMKDRKNNLDILTSAFISKGIRDEPTNKQKETLAENFFLNHKIESLTETSGSKVGAIRSIVLGFENFNSEDPEMALLQKLKRYKKAMAGRTLPFPYYGLDIVEFDRGNKNHRLEIYLCGMPAEINGKKLFGDTVITYPLVNPTSS